MLALRSADGNWVWSFVIDERDGSTRLISRNRFRLPSLAAKVGMIPMEPASLVMERKMLRGIKERAERLAGAEAVSALTNNFKPTSVMPRPRLMLTTISVPSQRRRSTRAKTTP